MEEDIPNLVVTLIINGIIFVVIPLVMAYRRGYFINFAERLQWIRNFQRKNCEYLPADWTIIKLRPLSSCEKCQIHRIIVKLMPHNREGYWALVILKSGKTIEYPLGENKSYWSDTEIPINNILIRKWQKGTQYKYDIIPIKENEQFS